MSDAPIQTHSERWDSIAFKVHCARGKWVEVAHSPEDTKRGGRNNKVREALALRGITAEVKSRIGHNTPDRPWVGTKTWAREVRR